MPIAARIALALALALAQGRAVAAADHRCTLPHPGAWHEYRSRHFAVTTDLDRGRADALVFRLEKLHALLVKAMVGDVEELAGRVRVLAIDDRDRFRALAGRDVAAYWTTTRDGEAAVVVPASDVELVPSAVAHELAHHLSWSFFARQPTWFSEGLVEFVETVARGQQEEGPVSGVVQRRGDAGLLTRPISEALSGGRVASARELLSLKGDEGDGTDDAYSWLLYQWLWSNRVQQFSDFRARLAAAEEPALAWGAAFPELDPASPDALRRLDEALARYRRAARYAYLTVTADVDGSAAERALSSADVHGAMLEVRGEAPGPQRERALRAEAEEALREDPHQPVAIAVKAQLDKASPVAALRAAAQARPDDPSAWLALGEQLPWADRAEQEVAFRKAVALAPDAPRPHQALAWLLAHTGRAHDALPLATRAVDLAPWNPVVIDTLAEVAMALDQCKQALTLERRALALAPGGATGASLEKRRDEYQRRCGGGAGATR